MKDLKKYEIVGTVAQTRTSVIYRARRSGESATVVIKELKTQNPSSTDIARFKQGYESIKAVVLDGIMAVHEIIEHEGRIFLVLEDFNGIPLKQALKQNRLDIKSFLVTAIPLCETLGYLHQKDIIHRAIKPKNIYINANTRRVKITNFGIESVLTRENDEIYHPDVIRGSLAYVSPEQTGRMNRPVDYRTDLYSLGITFYEMLTGTVPFLSNDAMEVIHSHMAITPPPPVEKNPDLPWVISNITMRLLSKPAEERYQNAFGVKADLKECIDQLENKGGIQTFELCLKDISNRFIIPPRLYGREKELAHLLSAFEEACSPPSAIKGAGEKAGATLMLVAGNPGIGKSALVNEVHKPIVARRGYFISGKYEQFRKDRLYSAIIQAFQGLVRQILSENELKIAAWREALMGALGPNGKVIADIIPDVELIIHQQPDIPALGPEESRNRFNLVFEKFVSVFPTRDHPVVLFLDDLQWADVASLDMIKKMITSPDIHYLFIIGAYRDNEVPDTHPLVDTLKEVEKQGINIKTIGLGPLTSDDVNHLIVNFLKCSRDRGEELGALVHKKTGGNPFFANQFLKALYDERQLELDPEQGWQWNAEQIKQMQVTDNIVDLLVQNINKSLMRREKH